MILVGIVFQGPELKHSRMDSALTAAMKAAQQLRGDFQVGDCPAVNVVFYVPGSVDRPDWKGLRDAKYSAPQKLVMVQIAVPDHVVTSPNVSEYIVESLHGANAVAFEFFRQRNIEFPLREAEDLVRQIKDRLKEELKGQF
jgi:hypothetical protein